MILRLTRLSIKSCGDFREFIPMVSSSRRQQTAVASKTKLDSTFSALTPLVGRQEEHPACKNGVMRCWCGCLSGAMCRSFAYGPADATAIPKPHHLLPHSNPDWFYLSGTGLPRLFWNRGRYTGVCVCVSSVGAENER